MNTSKVTYAIYVSHRGSFSGFSKWATENDTDSAGECAAGLLKNADVVEVKIEKVYS